jgi:predicted Holliday junction resolvase-like endonuclease
MNVLLQTIDGLQEVLGICPCCGELFRLIEAKFVFPKRLPRPCEFLELLALERHCGDEDARMTAAEERFEQKFADQCEQLREEARIRVKRRMKIIDPTFTARNIDPQDVKAIFHPVEYIVFNGLCSGGGVDHLKFISRTPQTRAQEILVNSMDATVRGGNIEFEILHLKNDGSFAVRKA